MNFSVFSMVFMIFLLISYTKHQHIPMLMLCLEGLAASRLCRCYVRAGRSRSFSAAAAVSLNHLGLLQLFDHSSDCFLICHDCHLLATFDDYNNAAAVTDLVSPICIGEEPYMDLHCNYYPLWCGKIVFLIWSE